MSRPSKRRRQCETCINCRSSRKQCDKGSPCRNCAENNRKCLYAVEFPYPTLSAGEQAAVLERLLYETRGRFQLLTAYVEQNNIQDWESQVVVANAHRHLQRNIRLEADFYLAMRRYTASWIINVASPGRPELRLQDRVFQGLFDRNGRILELMGELPRETIPSAPRMLQPTYDLLPIDLARAMVSVEEVEMMIALYNDCYSFSAMPDFISPRFEENGEYDLLLSSVMTLMLSHCVNLHAMKVDNHQVLSHAFYFHTIELRDRRVAGGIDIMALHATFNIMLYEAENGYLEQCARSRQYMAIMIDVLHTNYGNMSVWQQNLLRHLLWAIFTADASQHSMRMQEHVLCAPYMHVHKQRPSDQSLQIVDKLKEEYIYYRCRLAANLRHIWQLCYGVVAPSVDGAQVKLLEDEMWDLYYDLPSWITDDEKALDDIVLTACKGYECFCDEPHPHRRTHPICHRSLVEVWMRRLRYHFLVEWHGAWIYLYQIFLPRPGNVIQLPFMRCLEHAKLMVDVMDKWADDPDFFDCYCYPSLRSLLVASHIHRYLLQSEIVEVRQKGYQLLLQLFSIIQRSNIYHMYKETSFILGIKSAFAAIRHDYLRPIPVTNGQPAFQPIPDAAGLFSAPSEADLNMFSAAAS
ncbi:hypothetical protein BCR43DRAFT_521631 [Syncephalastrum racemosum]|uniref:Zn(2)-C6 fungal-type domain-containing protein n=1 Tax=Syncephalastrum racemosum TaxID=13706 RepID=A0A1X2HMM4_SYNRA|nr:hypothetical protein BCR43DRAFT_521631 [Syncephalastrum racemosum]